MKGAGLLDEGGRSKHRRERAERPSEERSEVPAACRGKQRELALARPRVEQSGGFQGGIGGGIDTSQPKHPESFRGALTIVSSPPNFTSPELAEPGL